ncbi:MAG: hypothetical protein QOI66_1612 [Myxococcales bacterium]|nr:hypothetical protein [Myxococcales bacterium]
MTRPVFSRRTFLGSVGAAGMGALIPTLDAEAATTGAKKRLILLTSPNGTVHTDWKPGFDGTTLTLSKALAPLEAHKQDILALDGLGWQYGDGPGVDHMRICMMWNGTPMLTGTDFSNSTGDRPCGWGGGISVDQQVANQLVAKQMIATPFKSLEFGVYQGKSHIYTRVSYAGANQPLPTEPDPAVMFTRLFKNGVGQPMGAADLTKLRARRKSVMDAVVGNLTSMQTRVSAGDRLKIDAHLTAVRGVEQRLDGSTTGPMATCTPPTLPATKLDPLANDNYPTISRLQMDMMTIALACDMTRVASLLWSSASSDIRFTWIGIKTGHHTISHDTSATARAQMTQMHNWYSGELAYLLDKLKAVQEAGSTLLDNTMVVWGNELADGAAHSQQPIPVLIAGRAAGQIKTGRYIDYGKKKHNPLLVSICNMMGLTDVTKFGTLDDGSGPLSGLGG